MNRNVLIKNIKEKDSYLCIGLDTDIHRLPEGIEKNWNGIVAFNKAIIEATSDLAVAYKPNIAFYESLGIDGWRALEKTMEFIPDNCFTIADAKRGDIGNTSKMYAKTFFETFDFDSVTVAPYMGSDSIEPFLTYKDKWVIILGLTSNTGARDIQFSSLKDGRHLYEEVIKKCSQYGNDQNTMFVIGATKAEYLKEIRKIIPEHFLLVPGVGAQGGSIHDVIKYGSNKDGGLLINSSRGILYASSKKDFAEAARKKALELSIRG